MLSVSEIYISDEYLGFMDDGRFPLSGGARPHLLTCSDGVAAPDRISSTIKVAVTVCVCENMCDVSHCLRTPVGAMTTLSRGLPLINKKNPVTTMEREAALNPDRA